MSKKVCLITGATSGLGLEAAKTIAINGFNIIVVGRNIQKCEQAKKEILAIAPASTVWYYYTDLSSIKNVKELAEIIILNHSVIDVLINNAGAVYSNFELSEDGIEKTLANNHLSYFILTLKLLPIIERSGHGRIINVASDSHYKGKIDIESFTKKKNYFILKAYEQSKLANVLFTYYLSKKLQSKNTVVNALHPGHVKTNIGAKAKNWLHNLAWILTSRVKGISVEEGISNYIYLAIDEEAGKITGKYFDKRKAIESAKLSYDEKLQEELWAWSEKATGIKY